MATLIATLAPASAGAATTALEPVADAYVSGAKPRANFGRKPLLKLGGSARARGYLRFEVAVERPITRAVLELRSRSGNLRGLKVGTAAGGWSERKITFRRSPRARMGRATARAAAVGRLDVTSLVRKQGRVTLVVTGPKTRSLVVGSREARARKSRPRLLLTTENANRQPQAKVRLVNPTPRTKDLVIARVESSDPDGDALTHTYEWLKNGVVLPLAQGNALNLGVTGFGDKGDRIGVRVIARDGTHSSAPATSEEVVVVDSPPTCGPVSLSTDEDTPKSVVPSCTDDDGDALTYSVVDQGSKGTASVVAGELRYVPNADATGSDSFTYRASANGKDSAPATVSVTIASVDDPPSCSERSLTTLEDTPGSVAAACSDDGGGELVLEIVEQPSKGAASVDGGQLRYVPDANTNGADSFAYRASAGGKQSAPATVSVAVSPVNDLPVMDSAAIDQANPGTSDVLTVSRSATDVDGDQLTYSLEWLKNGEPLQDESGATLNLATPGNGDRGDAISVRVTASDGSASSQPLTSGARTIRNTAPAIGSAEIDQGSPRTSDQLSVTVVRLDADGDATTIAYQWRRNGTDLAGETGTTLDLGQAGNGDKGDAISVRVVANDGEDSSAPLTSPAQTIVNSAPKVDAVTIEPATPRTNDLLRATPQSSDADGDPRTYAYRWLKQDQPIEGETGATLDLSEAGNGERGDELSVEVTASDSSATSAPLKSDGALVQNSPPEADPLALEVDEGNTAGETVTLASADADGDQPALSITQLPAHGRLHDGAGTAGAVLAAGDPLTGAQVTYVPDAGYTGVDAFSYAVSDGTASDTATVLVTVQPVTVPNRAPVCAAVSLTVAEDTPGAKPPSCTDPDGDPLTYSIATNGTLGTASVVSGQLRYVPKKDVNGLDTAVTYKASDGELSSASTGFSVTITEVNDPPTLGDDQAVAQENGANAVLDVDDKNNDKTGPSNESGQELVMTDVTDPPHGRAFMTDEVDDVNYNADDNYNGQDSFRYTLCDNGTTAGAPDPKCTTATVYVTVARFVAPTAETAPIPHLGTGLTDDAADDTAIWVNRENPAASTIIGTNKFKEGPGLLVYGLDGSQLQAVAPGRQMNNVDLRDGVPYNGGTASIVAASDRTGGGFGLSFYTVNPSTGLLDETAIGTVPLSFEPYGLCLYKPASGPMSVYVTRDNSSVGRMDQYQLSISPTDTAFGATFIRTVNVGTLSEGCVADDHHGVLYVGEEDRGIWRYDAATPSNATRALVDETGPGENLRADVEGLAIAPPAGPDDGTGHLIASSQGNHTFTVYDRDPAGNAFVRSIDVVPNFDLGIDGVEDTDGIEVSSAALPGFDGGVFIAQDFRNQEPGDDEDAGAKQNFKLAPLAPFFAPPSLDP